MKKKRAIALILSLSMAVSVSACGKKESKETGKEQATPTESGTEATPEATEEAKPDEKEDAVTDELPGRRDASTERTKTNETAPLVLSTQTLDGKFSPFFGTSGYDNDVTGQTQLNLIMNNEKAEPVAGIEYPTAAWDFEMNTADDQSESTYKFWLKNGIKFSDGHVMNADDVLFNLYVYLDPAYDGSSTLYSMNIEGLKAYQTQIADESAADSKLAEFEKAAKDKVDAALKGNDDKETLDKVWSFVEASVKADNDVLVGGGYTPGDLGMEGPDDFLDTAKDSIILFYTSSCLGKELLSYKDGKYVFAPETGLTVDGMASYTQDDYIKASMKCIKESISPAEFDVAFGYTTVDDTVSYYAGEEKAAFLEKNKGTVKSISGISKGKEVCSDGVERETITVKIKGIDPKAIWNFGFDVTPMHYYAGQERHDKANGIDYFGVDFSSSEFMNELQKLNGAPMGAGPYKMTDANNSENPAADDFFKNGIVYFTANDDFCLGAPKIKYLRYKTINMGSEFDSVASGEVHYSDPVASSTLVNQITSDAQYSHMDYILVDNLGYGYIGINAAKIPDLNVRRALMSVMDPALTLGMYPGGLAAVIYRPMSQVSWAYPDNCTPMYPFDETGAAAVDYFLKAGYTKQADGTLLAPDGSKPSFTFTLPSAAEDHPAGQVFLKSQEILKKLGIEVIIDTDQDMLAKLDQGTLTVWAAAWQATIDPDMYQVYYSDPAKNQATSPKASGLYYLFENGTEEEKNILNELNDLVVQGRESLNVDERKPVYEKALDKVMEIAVELPTYQRKNMYVLNKTVIDETSLTPADQITPYKSPLSYIWEVSLLDQ